MPHDKDIEKLVLGCIIDYKTKYNEVRDIISEDCFYSDFHREIFEIFCQIESSGNEPDIFAILTEYRKKHGDQIDFSRILKLNENSSYQANVYQHVLHLCDLSAKRKLYELGNYLQTSSLSNDEDIYDIATHAKEAIDNLYTMEDSSVHTIKDAVKGVYDIINRNKNQDTQLTGSPTGFNIYDRRSGGLQKTDLVIIGGESSHGKTSLALSMVLNSAKLGSRIAFYSLEMKKEQLAARLMAIESGISSSQLLFSPLADYQFEQLDKSINGLYNSCLLFDDRSTSNIDTIINSIRSMKAKYDIDGAVIDYLQILNINMKGANEEQQMANASRRLKNLAKDLDIWIIALSQLNRDASNPVPNINRVRGSGQIFEAADVVIFVYQPIKYKKPFPEPFTEYATEGYAMIDVAKGRNIGVFKFLSAFNAETTHFIDVNISEIPKNNIVESTPF